MTTSAWPAWLTATLLIAALAALFIIAAPGADAHESDNHEFELRCNDRDTTNLWVDEGDDFTLQAKWNKDNRGTGSWIAAWDTNELNPAEAKQDSDFSPEHDEEHSKSRTYSTFNHTFHTLDDDLWEGQEAFQAGYSGIRPSGGTNRAGHYCTVYLRDDDDLKVTSALLWGNPANGSQFLPGERIRVRLTMNGNVQVPEGANIELRFEDSDGTIHRRDAVYNAETSSPNRPVFEYWMTGGEPRASKIGIGLHFFDGPVVGVYTNGTVSNVQPRFDGVETLQNYEQEGGYYDGPAQFGVDGRPKLTAFSTDLHPPQTDHVVREGPSSRTVSENTYRAGEEIRIDAQFNQEVTVSGHVGISIRIGSSGSWRGAGYHSGSGTQVLEFRYKVKATDRDDNGFRIDNGGPASGIYGNGSITSKNNNDLEMNPWYTGRTAMADRKVDGRPIVLSTEITSTPVDGDTYWTGENITFALNYNNEVDASGSPKVEVFLYSPNTPYTTDAQSQRYARYESGSGSKTLVFAYQVQKKDYDSDGPKLELSNNTSSMSGGTVTASGTTVEALHHYSAVDEDANHKIDGSLGDRLPPKVEKVQVTSREPNNGYYTEGDRIEVTVTFDEDVTVTGPEEGTESQPPYMDVLVGQSIERFAYQDNRGGDDQMVFHYKVKEGDEDQDGISISAASLMFGNHTVQDEDGNDALTDHDGVETGSVHRVDAVTPEVHSITVHSSPEIHDVYDSDEIIDVVYRFTEDITVTGSPQLALDFDGTTVNATYFETARELVAFKYTVQAGDKDNDGFAIGADAIDLNGGTIRDAAGNAANLAHTAATVPAGQKVDGVTGTPDTTAPTVTSVAITSTGGSDRVYHAGEEIDVSAVFSENVTVSGTPTITIDVGGQDKEAGYDITDGSTVIFSYTVQEGDTDEDGVSIDANQIDLNGGTIRDAANNDAVLTHDAVTGDHTTTGKVDGRDLTGPRITAITFTSDPGPDKHYGLNDVIEATVVFDEDVVMTPANDNSKPHLVMELDPLPGDSGQREVEMDYNETDGAEMTFTYTVVSQDRASDTAQIPANALDLNGATIQDEEGNDADLTSSSYLPVSEEHNWEYHQVDGSRSSDSGQTGGI
jgi:hypothetical protein